jgi:hypothetical protein
MGRVGRAQEGHGGEASAAGRKMMNASKASASAGRLEIARRLYNALVAQDPNRVIICATATVGWWLATICG